MGESPSFWSRGGYRYCRHKWQKGPSRSLGILPGLGEGPFVRGRERLLRGILGAGGQRRLSASAFFFSRLLVMYPPTACERTEPPAPMAALISAKATATSCAISPANPLPHLIVVNGASVLGESDTRDTKLWYVQQREKPLR